MANPDPARDIDRIFADGALIDEAVQTASHVAVDAHRRAGRPLVVFRNGRIDHVPPDELHERRDKPEITEALLVETEFSVPRTAREFTLWVEDRCQAIADAPALKRAGLLHESLFKKFYEEAYPLAVFVRAVFRGRRDVVCALSSDHMDYDAVLQDFSVTPPRTLYVELTTAAFDKEESLRMKSFLEHGHVPVFGRVSTVLKQDGSQAIIVDNEAVAHDELLARTAQRIENAIRRKSTDRHRGHYGRDHCLVISFDDWLWFGTDHDRTILRSQAERILAANEVNFSEVYILGLSGKTLLRLAGQPSS